jgi:PAS domain S-box-containing protein
MQPQLEHPYDEIKRLQRCINDLVSLLALPAIWSGGDPSQVLHTLLGALLPMLNLDLVSVRLKNPVGEASAEIVRVAQSLGPMPPTHEICEALSHSLGDNSRKWPPPLRNFMGEGDVSIVPVPLGLEGELGVIVAAAERADFPRQTEALLLSVAANQASIGLQEARLLSEQRRVASELDQRVAQRTIELAQTNDELRNEIADRRRAEEALRDSEQSLRLILDGIAGLVAIMSATGEVEVVNRQASDYFGKTLEEMERWSTSDAVHPDDLPGVISAWRHSVETLSPYDIDHRLRRADNVYRWFHARGLPLFDAEGRIVRWYVLLTDIDDRRRAEEALQARERELRVIVNAVPALAWSARPDGSAEFFNQHYLAYVGLPLEQLQGSAWTVAVHPDDMGALTAAWRSMMAAGKAGEVEGRLRRFDGEYRWFLFRTNPMLDESGNILKWYGTNADIHDRKRAEEQLQRSEAFLTEGQKLSRIGNFSWLVATDDIKWSDQLYCIFEFELGVPLTFELIGSRVHPEDLPLLYDMIGKAQRGVSDFEYEHRLLMPDRSIKYLHLIAHGTRDREGRQEYIGAVQDVTQRRLSEEALGKARSELANVARVTSLGVLTASIAHEVNQPLSGIITNAGTCLRMLSADPPNLDGARETARRTIRDGNRASDVITRLRTLYSKKDLSPESMDLNEATREVTSLSLSELQSKRVILRHELADNLPPVIGDRVQLQQVILNLLRNASDAMSGVDDRPRELLIRTECDEGDRVRLSVKDAGVGLTPQAADKLFEAFFTTKSDGMGIGLSISRSIIEAHRGRLWATANDGPGATFAFSIPCRRESLADAESRVN